jgi:uroporphyrin-III C-methyltransferase
MASIIPSSLLAALNCRGNTHLVIGTNPLAATRCTQSLSSGARPILIAPEGSELHYALQKKIDDGSVQWHKKQFEDADLLRLGREEVDGVVDAVFVTSGPRDPQSRSCNKGQSQYTKNYQVFIFLPSANEIAFP